MSSAYKSMLTFFRKYGKSFLKTLKIRGSKWMRRDRPCRLGNRWLDVIIKLIQGHSIMQCSLLTGPMFCYCLQ